MTLEEEKVYTVCIATTDLNKRTQYIRVIRYPATFTKPAFLSRSKPYDHEGQAVDDLVREIRIQLPEAVVGPAIIAVREKRFPNNPAGIEPAVAEVERLPPNCEGMIAIPQPTR